MIKKHDGPNDRVILSRDEYESLVRASRLLNALECAGVDNWEGYADSWAKAHDEENGT